MARTVVLVIVGGLLIFTLGSVLLAGTFAGAMWGTRDVVADRMDTEGIRMPTRPRSYKDERRHLGMHLGPVDGIKVVEQSVNPELQKTRFRFEATPQQIAAIAARLNLVPYPIRSKADHGLRRGRTEPEWWQPEAELTCCTQYRGQDLRRKWTLVLVYNSDSKVAYAEMDEPGDSH
jgi:hypothetical protein